MLITLVNREYEAKEAARLERERLILQQRQEEEIAREGGEEQAERRMEQADVGARCHY